jgi:hypothetical protein
MNEILIDSPMSTVNALLKLHIGDEGRLLYLRNALKNGKVIFNSDKIFLQRMQEKLDQMYKKQSRPTNISSARLVTQKKLSEYNSHISDFTNRIYNLSQSNQEYKNKNIFEEQKQVPDLEKILFRLTDSIAELKETQSKILTNLEIMKNDYKNYAMHNQRSNEIITDNLNKKNSESEFTKKDDMKFEEFFKKEIILNKSRVSHNFKISDIMAWSTSGVFVVWFASFLNLIDMGPFQNLLLGLSLGLAICVGLSHKMQKK